MFVILPGAAAPSSLHALFPLMKRRGIKALRPRSSQHLVLHSVTLLQEIEKL